MRFTINNQLMNEFSQWLKNKRKKSGMTLMQLKSAIGDLCSDAYLSKLENDRYKGKKGNPARPDKEIVVALAEVFNDDVNYVLKLANYAPDNARVYPQTYPELIEALKEFGICNFQIPKQDMELLSPEFFKSVIDFFENTIKGKIQKEKEGEAFDEQQTRKIA